MSKCRYVIKLLSCEIAGSEPLGLPAALLSYPNRCGNNGRPEGDKYRHHVAPERQGRPRHAGDQLVKLKVVLPKAPDPELEAFVSNWGGGKTYNPREAVTP